jgi:tRNA(fMet)-specific endonuclease VapC
MKRYLFDTNALSDFINNRRGVRDLARDAKRAGGRIGTCFPALAELYYGIEYSSTRETNHKLVRAALGELTLWPFDLSASQEYGRLFAQLRRIGRPMQHVDVMVAAIALTLGNCTVVTTDADLAAVPGLRTEDWTIPVS